MLSGLDALIENIFYEEGQGTEDEKESLGAVYKYDFKKKRFELVNGRLVECTPLEACQQWIELLLRTKMGKYPIYESTQFGSQLDQWIGYKMRLNQQNATESQLKQSLTENKRILDVEKMEFKQEGHQLHIEIKVHTIYGELNLKLAL